MAVAIALAAAPAMAGSTFDQTVFFGDSFTDSGYFQPVLPESVLAEGAGRFTTNPGLTWAEYLADYYGTDATPNGLGRSGDNYAIGGARVGQDRTQTDLLVTTVPVHSLATQVSNYLRANGGAANPNALYTVWGGTNDLLPVAGGADVQTKTTIASAVGAQVGIVATLEDAGARYVMVPTIPDLGLIPRYNGDAVASAEATALASAYNKALFSDLKSAGLRVIPVDTFHLLQEIVADPATYGFTNVTDAACTVSSLWCNPTTLVSADAASTYVFADTVHLTTATNQILAQYALSILEAPRLQQVLTHSAQVTGRARAYQVAWHLDGKPESDGLRWWGNARGDIQDHDDGDLYDGAGPAGLFGLDWSRGDLVFGGFGGFGQIDADFGNRRGDFTQDDTTLGGFLGWYPGRGWVNAQVSYSWLDYDVDRKVVLGPVTRVHGGSPDGSDLTAAIYAGYGFGQGTFRHGPVAGLIGQKVKLDGYVESNTSSTALGYRDQDNDSLVSRVGWQVRFDGAAVKPYLQVTYDHEFEEGGVARAWLQSVPTAGTYSVPGLDFARDYATVVVGAHTDLWGVHSNFGVTTTVAQDDAHDTTVFVNFGRSF